MRAVRPALRLPQLPCQKFLHGESLPWTAVRKWLTESVVVSCRRHGGASQKALKSRGFIVIARRQTAWLILQPVAGLEDPRDDRERYTHEDGRHDNAHADTDVGEAVKAPAEAADHVHHRVEERYRLPERRQHVDRIEAAAEEGER